MTPPCCRPSASGPRRPAYDRVGCAAARGRALVSRLPSWLVDTVPRDHGETDAVFRHRRRVVAGVAIAGSGLLGASLTTKPHSPQFYALTLGLAGTWLVGGLRSGPLHLGWVQTGHDKFSRPVITPIAAGVGAFGIFYGAASLARHIPLLNEAITAILQYAHEGSDPLVLATTLANGVGEEIFFRGFWLRAMRAFGAGAIWSMVVPYCMIHYGKPYLEACAAVVAGVVLGSLAMRTRSIYAGFLVHGTVAILMDVLALYRRHALPSALTPRSARHLTFPYWGSLIWIAWALALGVLAWKAWRKTARGRHLAAAAPGP